MGKYAQKTYYGYLSLQAYFTYFDISIIIYKLTISKFQLFLCFSSFIYTSVDSCKWVEYTAYCNQTLSLASYP